MKPKIFCSCTALVGTMINSNVRMPLTLIMAALALGVSCIASAQEFGCESALTQHDINVCTGRGATRADSLLVQLVSEIKESLGEESYDALQAIQSEWRASREATCRWKMELFNGGSIAPTIYAGCITTITWQRIDYLKINLCEGAGMTGPCDQSRRYQRPRHIP